MKMYAVAAQYSTFRPKGQGVEFVLPVFYLHVNAADGRPLDEEVAQAMVRSVFGPLLDEVEGDLKATVTEVDL